MTGGDAWWSSITRTQWRALIAALAGWMLDRMDVMLFTFALNSIRALSWSILIYSFATALTATSHSVAELVLWRLALGIGLGGEWSAGSVLVAETWPAQHRGKAIGIMQSGWAVGYLLAALLALCGYVAFGFLADRFGRRPVFIGFVAAAALLVPALGLTSAFFLAAVLVLRLPEAKATELP